MQLLCDIELPKVFIAGIDNFNVTRNKLMHYELELSEAEVNETTRDLKGLYEEAVNFFGTYIDNIAELLEAARFESTDSDYAEAMAEWYQDMAYDEYVEQQLEREND